MKKIRLGRTDLEVSRIGLGGIPLQRPSEDEAVDLVKYAIDQGINLIDTSRHYGTSELRIGKGIEGRREDVILISRQATSDSGTAKFLLKESLSTLKTDYLDIWEFHNFTKEKFAELMKSDNVYDEQFRLKMKVK